MHNSYYCLSGEKFNIFPIIKIVNTFQLKYLFLSLFPLLPGQTGIRTLWKLWHWISAVEKTYIRLIDESTWVSRAIVMALVFDIEITQEEDGVSWFMWSHPLTSCFLYFMNVVTKTRSISQLYNTYILYIKNKYGKQVSSTGLCYICKMSWAFLSSSSESSVWDKTGEDLPIAP